MGGSSLQLLLTFFLFLLCMKPALGNYWGVGDANLGCKERERQALIKIKEDLIDDYGHLSSWSTKVGREDCCKWTRVHLITKQATWLRPLSSLSFLRMSSVNLSKVNNWLHVVNQLPYLTVLVLRACSLSNIFPIPHVNSSASLDVLSLSYNNLTLSSSVLEWLFNSNTSVVELYLHDNQFQGLIPNAFSRINSLEVLILDDNEFEGGIPKGIGGLCNLNTLSLSHNKLSGQLLEFVHNLTGCANHSIEALYLDNNHIMGSFPDLTTFSSLKVLWLSNNQLSGTIPESLGKQSNLERLYIGGNHLKVLFLKPTSQTHKIEALIGSTFSIRAAIFSVLSTSLDYQNGFKLKKVTIGLISKFYDFGFSFQFILDLPKSKFYMNLSATK
ncbi:receptor-like protein eix1 [Quercus suber]|uniref:Receptor-like protein eix1 n=1 Tax=Quercus suber TaxID=58331 RepID=A0AAW0M1L3_QUESU